MSEWAQKRFWTRASAEASGNGWIVTLDDRTVRTPARAVLALPTQALAEAIAMEWDAQEGVIRPATMPLTRAANSAVDKVVPQFDVVADMLAEYGATDLLCHRAEGPDGLAHRQAEAWDPLLDWARDSLQAPLTATTGMLPVAQPAQSRARLRDEIGAQDAYALTALHDLVTLSGSLIIGLAVQQGLRDPDALWDCSRVDETWQQEQWGLDAEADEAAEARRRDFLAAARFHGLARPDRPAS
jgi:chaperone required for assembly of F1-ATPase